MGKGIDFFLLDICEMYEKSYLTQEQTCEILCVSKETLYRMRKNGEIPYLKINNKIIYLKTDVMNHLKMSYHAI